MAIGLVAQECEALERLTYRPLKDTSTTEYSIGRLEGRLGFG